MKKVIFLLSCTLLFFGCGYKPSSYYAKNAINGDVYVSLKVDIKNAQNSVYVKDAMNEMIINEFKANLTDNKEKADSFVDIALSSVSHISMSTDDDGYVASYRTTVFITVGYYKKGEKKKIIKVSNYYDYAVEPTSTLSDQKKNLAVKIASSKALSDLFSKIAVNSMKE